MELQSAIKTRSVLSLEVSKTFSFKRNQSVSGGFKMEKQVLKVVFMNMLFSRAPQIQSCLSETITILKVDRIAQKPVV